MHHSPAWHKRKHAKSEIKHQNYPLLSSKKRSEWQQGFFFLFLLFYFISYVHQSSHGERQTGEMREEKRSMMSDVDWVRIIMMHAVTYFECMGIWGQHLSGFGGLIIKDQTGEDQILMLWSWMVLMMTTVNKKENGTFASSVLKEGKGGKTSEDALTLFIHSTSLLFFRSHSLWSSCHLLLFSCRHIPIIHLHFLWLFFSPHEVLLYLNTSATPFMMIITLKTTSQEQQQKEGRWHHKEIVVI